MKKKIFIAVLIAICLNLLNNNKCYSQGNDTKKDLPLTIVEEMPQFPGGNDALSKFLGDNLKYPKLAREEGISGTVYVSFVVRKDGTITSIKILRGIGGGCDEEVERVVKLMPKWKPGKQKGEAVAVQFNLPVKFTLSDDNDKKPKKKNKFLFF